MERALATSGVRPNTLRGDAVTVWVVLAALVVAEGIISWLLNEFVLTKDLVIAASGGQLDPTQAERMMQLSERFQWLGYTLIAPFLLARTAVAALVLQLSILFFESKSTTFGVVFRAAVLAHAAKVLEMLVGVAWWLAADGPRRTARFLAGNPLSLMVLVDGEGPLMAIKPLLDQLSLGSVAWIVIATTSVAVHLQLPRRKLLFAVAMAWCGMVGTRFTLSQVLAAFVP